MKVSFFIGIFLLVLIPGHLVLASQESPRRVLLVGWDGAQQAHVKECLQRHALPNLEALVQEGAILSILVEGRTETEPGFARILTGYNTEINHIAGNETRMAIPPGYTVFERLEDHFGDKGIITAAVINKKHRLGYITKETPYYHAAHVMDVFDQGLLDDVKVADHAIALLERHQKDRSFFFVAFALADIQGHHYGENSKEYDDALIAYDRLTGRLVQKLKDLGIYESTVVYVTADHGFDEGSKGHRAASQVFLASNHAAAAVSGVQTDITPTILDKFGVKIDILVPPLDGRPLNR